MGSMTRIHPITPDATEATIAQAYGYWADEMAQGDKLLKMAKNMREEADKAVAERAQMKQDYRDRMPTVSEVVADHRVGGFKIMGDAKADDAWFTRRAVMYATESAAHFAAAANWMAYVNQHSHAH